MDSRSARPNPLLIPELFQSILDCLHLPQLDRNASHLLKHRPKDLQENQQALSALAQTCSALSEQALDRLWRRLDSLEPFVRSYTHPFDLYRTIEDPPWPAEHQIITRYSHRVREATLVTPIDAAFLQSACSHPQSPLLFPNIRVLRWYVDPGKWESTASLNNCLQWLFSPALLSASVDIERGYGTEYFLQSLVQIYQHLKLQSIRFHIFQRNYTMHGKISLSEIQYLSQVISTQQHLESLDVSVPIIHVSLRHILLSPQLKVVSLVLHPNNPDLHDIGILPSDIPFRNVRVLELRVWDLDFISSLLRLQGQMFHMLRLILGGPQDLETITAFLTTLASPQRADSLQSIYLDYQIYVDDEIITSYDSSVHILTYQTLYSLATLKHLRELRIHIHNLIFLRDDELTELVGNWPMLEVLQLKCIHACYGTPLTLRGLLSLLGICPRLRRLSLSLDARVVPTTAITEVRNTTLTSIRLPDSPICDARLVADFFSRHLPCITSIDSHDSIGDWSTRTTYRSPREYHVLWRRVLDYMCTERKRKITSMASESCQ